MIIRIKGLNRLNQSFLKYYENRYEGCVESVAIAAHAVELDAKRVVPVDTGRLRSSIKIEPAGKALTKSISANTVYAQKIEYSHKRVTQGYMRPAFRRAKEIFLKDIRRKFRKDF